MPKRKRKPTVTIRSLQSMLDRKWPGAWSVCRNKTGFVLTRIDSVELIDITELTAIATRLRDFRAYATLGPRTEFAEDGYVFEMWLMPKARTRRRKR